MAEQGFSVRLTARTEQYQAAMKDAQASTESLAKSGVNFDQLGSKLQNVGVTMSKAITLPLIAVGGAAVKMSTDFDSAFGRMVGLAGVTADEVDGLKKSVLDLAGQTGQAPQQLADGLYFLRSSGLDAAKAMDALQVSAKASAAGLGPTAVIADAVSSAMNAYAKSGLSAAQATDILTATARAGKAEPAELAGALGRVLPIASELGISFKDVGGAIASLSLTGNDASTSATLLTNIMTKLLKPSQQSAQALATVGVSAGSIREMIAEKGLLGTLDDLKARLGDAGFVKFLEDAQAVQGALSLTGQNASHVHEVFDQVANSVGATDQAFAAATQTSGFKMKQAWAEVQVALIKAGDVIVPIVAGVAGAIGHLAELFSGLSKPVQLIVVAFLGLVAAAGPLLMVAGSLIKNFQLVKTSFTEMAAGASTASLALGAIGVVMIAATAWYADNARKKAELTAITNTFTDALKAEADGQKGAVDASIAASLNNPKLIEQAKVLGLTVSDLAKIIRGESVPAYEKWQQMAHDDTWTSLGSQMNDVVFAFGTVNSALAPLNDGFANAKAGAAQLAENQKELGMSTERTAEQVAAQTANFNEQLGLLPAEAGGLDAVTAAADAVKAAQEEAARKADVFSAALQTQIDKLAELYPKQYDAVQAKYDYRDSVAATLVKLDALNTTLGDHKAKQEDVTNATNAARDAILDQAAKFATLDGAAVGSEGAIRRQIQSLEAQRDALSPTSPLRAFLDEYIADLQKIPSNISTILDLHISQGAVTTAAGDIIGKRSLGPGSSVVSAGGRFAYGGSNVYSSLGEISGPAGDEVVLPVGNASALRSWLSDPRVSAPIAAAWPGSSGHASAQTPVVNHNTVQFNGGINNTIDMKAAWQQANFALASAA